MLPGDASPLLAGLFTTAAPQSALTLVLSTGQYGDDMPRRLGLVLFALGVVIVQIYRYHVEALYATTVGVRLIILVVLAALYVYPRDPLFLTLFAIVGLGVYWSPAPVTCWTDGGCRRRCRTAC